MPFLTRLAVLVVVLWSGTSCSSNPSDQDRSLVTTGRNLFFQETFDGNGRTCSTCHRLEDNFRITPAFIATLPADDPLFVADFNPDLADNFEKPELLRRFGLILMNPDGFDDLENKFVMRTVQSLRALKPSIGGAHFEGYENQIDFQGVQTGWAGDGAPGDGSLRSFAIGAIRQHMTKTLARVEGVDFRLPTPQELDALEAFMLTIGRQEELELPLPLKSQLAVQGQKLFLDPEHANARCSICHINAGASSMSAVAISEGRRVNLGNIRHSTGEESLLGEPNSLIPFDDGFGNPGDRTFNTPSLVEAADAGPLFHNGAVASVEEAVALYNLETFNNSTTGAALARRFGGPTNLSASEVLAIGAFLRVINALDNIRESLELLEESRQHGFFDRQAARELITQASYETQDAIQVLEGTNLHPLAVARLKMAEHHLQIAAAGWWGRGEATRRAIDDHLAARSFLTEG